MIDFTFKTKVDYNTARIVGSVNDYKIARVKIHGPSYSGWSDFPVHSKEEFDKLISELEGRGAKWEAYQANHLYDIQDHD